MAEQYFKTKHGAYVVYHSVLNTSFLEPDVARQYGLARSKSLALLNISVQKQDSATNTPIDILIKGTVRNIVGQQRQLEFKAVREGTAIYYLSTFRISDDDVLSFDLQIQPNTDLPPLEVKFQQRVYVQ